MSRNVKRLTVAMLISSSCFALTVTWYEMGKSKKEKLTRPPIARLHDSTNDVQRKPTKRVIWESVTRNEDLYPGEAIRTTADAEAKIHLVKSGAVIHLEPNSLVVLEENENGIGLDFLQGNLFLSGAGNKNGEELTLKTGTSELKLNGADMSVSKDPSGQVNLRVFNGQAALKQGEKEIAIEKNGSAQIDAKGVKLGKELVQVLWPKAGEPVLLNLLNNEDLVVEFKPLPPGFEVSAEMGKSRSNLRPVGPVVRGETGKLPVTGKAGKWFLRLVAKSNLPEQPLLNSSILPVAIEPKSAPTLVAPKNDAPVVKRTADSPLVFRWQNRLQPENQILEIATDAQFKNSIISQNLSAETSEHFTQLPDGTYFWRVTSFVKYRMQTEALASTISRFVVQSTWELRPPTLLSPADQERITQWHAATEGVTLRWQLVPGVQQYALWLQDKTAAKNLIDTRVAATHFKVATLKPGIYEWKVSSLDPTSDEPSPSPTSQFVVEERPALEWVDSEPVYEFITAKPSLKAHWKAGPDTTKSYRYRIATPQSASELSELSVWQSTNQTQFEASLPREGIFEVVVEALSAKGEVVASSSSKSFIVKRKPLLPAPQWANNMPEVVKTDVKGNANLDWQQVEGAKHYLMILQNDEGVVVEKKQISRTTASLTQLKPGQYKVTLKSVDESRRSSAESTIKDILVPTISEIRAPKIKNMKVK